MNVERTNAPPGERPQRRKANLRRAAEIAAVAAVPAAIALLGLAIGRKPTRLQARSRRGPDGPA